MKESKPRSFCKCGHTMHQGPCRHVEPATFRHVIFVGGDVQPGERSWHLNRGDGLVCCACPGGLLGLVTGRKVPLRPKAKP